VKISEHETSSPLAGKEWEGIQEKGEPAQKTEWPSHTKRSGKKKEQEKFKTQGDATARVPNTHSLHGLKGKSGPSGNDMTIEEERGI